MRSSVVIPAILLCIVAGCNNKGSGSEFVGKWHRDLGSSLEDLDITRSGDGFAIRETTTLYLKDASTKQVKPFGSPTIRIYTASYLNGILQGSSGYPVAFSVDKTNGHLIGDGADYLKAK